MALLRANADDLLHEGLKQVLFQKYEEAKPIWKSIFNTGTSKKKYESGSGFSGFGMLVEKDESTGFSNDDPILGYDTKFTHKAFGLETSITKEMMDDDQYNVIKRIPGAFAKSAVRTEETYAANIFNNGFVAGGTFLTGGDGKALFAIDHPLTGGGTQSNKLSTAAALSVTSFEEAMYKLRRTTGDRGEFLALEPKGLLIPPELSREGTELLKSTLRPDTGDNPINWAAQQGISLVSPTGWVYLTSPTAWFILTDKDEHNLEFIMRNPLEDDAWRDHHTKDFLFSVYERFSVGFWDFRGVFGTEGA